MHVRDLHNATSANLTFKAALAKASNKHVGLVYKLALLH